MMEVISLEYKPNGGVISGTSMVRFGNGDAEVLYPLDTAKFSRELSQHKKEARVDIKAEYFYGIEKGCQYRSNYSISEYERKLSQGDFEKLLESKMCRKLADDILQARKLTISKKESLASWGNLEETYQAEVFIFTRQELEQFIANVMKEDR